MAGGKRKRKKKNIYYLKKGARDAALGFTSIFLMFLVILFLSALFLGYQYKEYKIVQLGKEIQQLKAEILQLNSFNQRLRAQISSQLDEYHRIARIAREKLQLEESIEKPLVLKVDKDKYLKYRARDEKEATK